LQIFLRKYVKITITFEKLFANFVEKSPEKKQMVNFLAYPPPKRSQTFAVAEFYCGKISEN
jgi:hypothetical protein